MIDQRRSRNNRTLLCTEERFDTLDQKYTNYQSKINKKTNLHNRHMWGNCANSKDNKG